MFEFGEKRDVAEPKYHTDDFILKITVPKVIVLDSNVTEKEAEKVAEKSMGKLTEKHQRSLESLVEKAKANGDKLSETRMTILRAMIENPYITRHELVKILGIKDVSVWRNIEAMRGKYLRRVGPDKGGFWEIIWE